MTGLKLEDLPKDVLLHILKRLVEFRWSDDITDDIGIIWEEYEKEIADGKL